MLAAVCVTILINSSLACTPATTETGAQTALEMRQKAPAEFIARGAGGEKTYPTSEPFIVRQGDPKWGDAVRARILERR